MLLLLILFLAGIAAIFLFCAFILLIALLMKRGGELKDLKKNILTHNKILQSRYAILLEWIKMNNRGIALRNKISKCGVSSVGVFGFGSLGELVIDDLLKSKDVVLSCIIESNIDKVDEVYCEVPIVSIDSIKKFNIDAIVISVPEVAQGFLSNLKKSHPKVRIMLLEEIVGLD